MNKLLWIFIVFCLYQKTVTEDIIETCLLKILDRHFLKESILIVTDLTQHTRDSVRQLSPNLKKEPYKNFITTLMQHQKWTFQVYNSDRYAGVPRDLRRIKLKNSIIFLREETVAAGTFLHELKTLQRNPLWNAAGKNLILIESKKTSEKNKIISKNIIHEIWTKSKAVDNLVMIVHRNGRIRFYTWFPYRQPYCSQVENITYLDTYKNGSFLRGVHLFPPKIKSNLEGCEMIVATDSCIPYVFLDPNNASRLVGGLEYYILSTFADHLNFKMEIVRPEKMWTTSANRSLEGAFKLLVEQKVDLAFSCLMLNKQRNSIARALPPYYPDSLAWFIPTPEHKSHFNDIFFTFPIEFWGLMLIALLASVFPMVLWRLRETGKTLKFNFVIEHLMKLIGMAVYGPVDFAPKRFILRLFVFIFFLYAMHITIAFQSSLFALYKTHRQGKYITSLHEGVDSGLFIYLRSSTQDLYNQTNHKLWNRILQPGRYGYLQDFAEAFNRIAYDKNAMALFIKSTGIYMISVYYTDEFGYPKIVWLRKNFVLYPVTTYLSPGHPMYEMLRTHTFRILHTGLVRFWMTKSVVGGKLNFYSNPFKNIPLSMTHMAGAFFVLLVLSCVAILVFIMEVIIFKYKFKSKMIEKKHDTRNFYPSRLPKGKKYPVTLVRVGNPRGLS